MHPFLQSPKNLDDLNSCYILYSFWSFAMFCVLGETKHQIKSYRANDHLYK